VRFLGLGPAVAPNLEREISESISGRPPTDRLDRLEARKGQDRDVQRDGNLALIVARPPGDLLLLDTKPTSPHFHTVVGVMPVGGHPAVAVIGEGSVESAAAGDWEAFFYFASRLAVLCVPAFFALVIGLSAVRSQPLSRALAWLHALGLAAIAAFVWMLWFLEDPDPKLAAGAGAVTLVVLGQAWIALRYAKHKSADRGHLIPLILLFIVGLGAVVTQHSNDQWHTTDYIVMVCGVTLGLAAIAMSAKESRSAS